MRVLAFDQASVSTGWCFGTKSGLTECGRINITPRRFDSIGIRFLRLDREVTALIKKFQPTLLALEEHRAHSSVISAQMLGAASAVIMKCAEEHGLHYASFPVARIKKFGSGSHNASKALMLASARKKYPHLHIENDDVADAVAICGLALATYSK
jgi:Holliday junction resolvasome RuvABC endonuclease subunit